MAWSRFWEETRRNFTRQPNVHERQYWMRGLALFCTRLIKKKQYHIWVFSNMLYGDKNMLQRMFCCDLNLHVQNKLLPSELLTSLKPQQSAGVKPTRCTSSVHKPDCKGTCALQHRTGRQQTTHEENQSRINGLQNNAQKLLYNKPLSKY